MTRLEAAGYLIAFITLVVICYMFINWLIHKFER